MILIINFLNANFEKDSTAELENILITDFHVNMEDADALLVEYQNYDGSAPNVNLHTHSPNPCHTK